MHLWACTTQARVPWWDGSPAVRGDRSETARCDLAAGLRRRDAKGSFLPGLGWSHRFVIFIFS